MTTEKQLARLQKRYSKLLRRYVTMRRVARKVEELYAKLSDRFEVLKKKG